MRNTFHGRVKSHFLVLGVVNCGNIHIAAAFSVCAFFFYVFKLKVEKSKQLETNEHYSIQLSRDTV